MSEESPMDRSSFEPEENERERILIEQGGLAPGNVKEVLAKWAGYWLSEKGSSGPESTENRRAAEIYNTIIDLTAGNPHVSARVLDTIESMVNNFVDPGEFESIFGRDDELAMTIATYLNTLPEK